jgi:2Fe-2S ferredoxin
MPDIVIVDRDGRERRLTGMLGRPVMETLREADAGIAAICGGMCSCATCHVWVDEDWMGRIKPAQPEETELVSSLVHARPNSRLSCQIAFGPQLDGLRVTVAPEE